MGLISPSSWCNEFVIALVELFQATANYCGLEKGMATMSQPSERQDENCRHWGNF